MVSFVLRVTLGYLITAALWIALSDGLLFALFRDNLEQLNRISELKGIGFVLVTSGALYLILNREWRHRMQVEQALRDEIDARTQAEAARAANEALLRESEQRFRVLLDSVPDFAIFTLDSKGNVTSWNAGAERIKGYTADEALGMNFSTFMLEEDRQSGRAQHALSEALRSGRFEHEHWSTRKDGTRFWANTVITSLHDPQGSIKGFAKVTRDLTERRQAEEALALQADRLNVLHQIDRAILAANSIEEIANAALDRMAELIPTLFTSIALFNADYSEVTIVAVRTEVEDFYIKPGLMTPTIPHVLNPLQQRGYVVLQELHEELDGYRYKDDELKAGLKAMAIVGLSVRSRLIGRLVLGYDQAHSVMQAHVEIAREIADQLAIAFDSAQLISNLRDANEKLQVLSRRLVNAQEDERRRIARELHDEVGQTLTGLNLALEADGRQEEQLLPERRHMIQQMVNGLTQRVRELSLDLRPAMLDDLGVLPALRWLFRRYTDQTGIEVRLSQYGFERRFEPELETAVFRIVQEALTNVARHAGVREASVDLWANHELLTVQIEDHGVGFDLEDKQSAAASAGLLGMRERAHLLGGVLVIDSQPGRGTTVIGRFTLRSSP